MARRRERSCQPSADLDLNERGAGNTDKNKCRRLIISASNNDDVNNNGDELGKRDDATANS